MAINPRREGLSNDLASLHRQLANLESLILTRKAQAWRDTDDLSITQRREEIQYVAWELQGEARKLQGDIRALEVLLAQIDMETLHADS